MLTALLACCLALSAGCSAKHIAETESKAQQHWDTLLKANCEIKITTDLAQSTLEYTLDYCYNKEDSDSFIITAPEVLQGIKASIADAENATILLQYDGTELDAPGPSRAGLTPADAVPYLLRTLRNSSPVEQWNEQLGDEQLEVLKFTQEDEEGAIMRQIWLREHMPLRAEIYADEALVMTLDFANWTIL